MAKAQSTLSFVNLPVGAHVAASGGQLVSSLSKDFSVSFQNPALLDSVENTTYYVMFSPFLGEVNRYYVGYAATLDNSMKLGFHLQYLGYGEMQRRDELGNDVGVFNARQYVFKTSFSSSVGPFSIGSNLSFAASNIDQSNRYGVLVDLGGLYRLPNTNMALGIVFRNLGYEFGGFEGGSFSSDLFDVVLGATLKPEYMPFRFSITASGLPNTDVPFSVNDAGPDNIDKVLQYFNFGTSLVLASAIEFTIGYNHQIREELRYENGAFGSGFSYGFIVRVKDFELQFTRSDYGAAGGASYFAVQNSINSLKKIF